MPVFKFSPNRLWSLYQSLSDTSPMRFHVYFYLVQLAGKTDQIGMVYKDMESFKSQFSQAQPSNEQMQKLLRLLHEVLLNAKKRYVEKKLGALALQTRVRGFVPRQLKAQYILNPWWVKADSPLDLMG